MARLDKSQGITFVYTNIYELYQKAKKAKLNSPLAVKNSRIIKGNESLRRAEIDAFDALRKEVGAGFAAELKAERFKTAAFQTKAEQEKAQEAKVLQSMQQAEQVKAMLLKAKAGQEAAKAKKETPEVRILKDMFKTGQNETVELKKQEFERPMGVKEAERKAMEQVAKSPLSNLRKNLNNLNEAHAKLRFLLKELEELTKKK